MTGRQRPGAGGVAAALVAVLLLAGCGAGAGVGVGVRAGVRVPDTADRVSASAVGRVPGPDLSRRVPVTSSRRPSASGTEATAPRAAAGAAGLPAGTTIRIGTWSAGVVRGGQDEVDACKDAVQWAGPSSYLVRD
ncbi:hypothetical protein [Streptomyces sp. NPDC058457]|uniref:hypothetical protein n=1 Tax=Streptomyces sp. NPDC058457 TaxID=3346507 RepID=UPI00364D9261